VCENKLSRYDHSTDGDLYIQMRLANPAIKSFLLFLEPVLTVMSAISNIGCYEFMI
jgi:hypothetical protein